MSIHRFDHIDLRVSDFAQARKFYDVFLRELGFPKIRAAKTEISYYAEGERKMVPFIGLNEEPGHRGNANRFAFWADTEEEVNRLGAIIREAGYRGYIVLEFEESGDPRKECKEYIEQIREAFA